MDSKEMFKVRRMALSVFKPMSQVQPHNQFHRQTQVKTNLNLMRCDHTEACTETSDPFTTEFIYKFTSTFIN